MVAILTQFTKGVIDKFFKTRTKFIVYLYALALSWFISYTKGFEGDIIVIIVLDVLNSFIVAFAAMKTYETINGECIGCIRKAIKNKKERKDNEGNGNNENEEE
jgi:uncharacterized membrane protein